MERDEQMVLSESQNPAAEISEPSKVSAGASGKDQAGTEQNTNEKKSQEAAQNLYLGVVGGGYNNPIPTDTFSVVVPPNSPYRHDNRYMSRWVIVHVDTCIWDAEQKGQKSTLSTLGVVEDVEILPGAVYEDDREMAHSEYYSEQSFSKTFTTTQEDAIRLKVRAIGHLTSDRQDLYGPVRPPERESQVTVATPEMVKIAIMKPMRQGTTFGIGGYATLDGVYEPFTPIVLPEHQMFLHGTIFAASGWGKTVCIKRLMHEFHKLPNSPAIIVFNIKGGEFYRLEDEVPEEELRKIFINNLSAKRTWDSLQLQREGFDPKRISYYPVGVDHRRTGRRYTIHFSQIEPNEEGIDMLRFVLYPFEATVTETSVDALCRLVEFCKKHFTNACREHTTHSSPGHVQFVRGTTNSRSTSQSINYNDTFEGLSRVIRGIQSSSQGFQGGFVSVVCSACSESVQIHSASAAALSRVVDGIIRMSIFDGNDSLDTGELIKPGHVSVIDVAGLDSVAAQQVVISYVLSRVFRRANQFYLLGADPSARYTGVIIFLDEAWRFFKIPRVIDEIERISRMGRSLKVGLWLADQSIPTGEREWHVLNNMRTRILGSITAEPSAIRKVMPLSESMMSALANLRRGMGIFYNQEYSRIPVPVIIPPCTCYHEGD